MPASSKRFWLFEEHHVTHYLHAARILDYVECHFYDSIKKKRLSVCVWATCYVHIPHICSCEEEP